jgi:hypothetical protein
VEVARCAPNGWIAFVGDSELRGIVLATLSLLMAQRGDTPTPAEWLGINSTAHTEHSIPLRDTGSLDIGALDWFLRVDSGSGKVVDVVKWAALKKGLDDYKNASNLDLVRNLDGASGAAFRQCKELADPQFICLRISYSFVQDTFDLVHRELPLLGDLVKDATLVFLVGKWDLWWFNEHAHHWLKHNWYADNGLRRWSVDAGERAYTKLLGTLNELCTRPLGCTLLEVGYRTRLRQPRSDEYVATIRRIVKRMPALRALDRFELTTTASRDHMVDHAHFDGFVNLWTLHQLVAVLCDRPQSVGPHVCTETPPTECLAQGVCTDFSVQQRLGRRAWHADCTIGCRSQPTIHSTLT